jgi:hypothetical protein
MKFEKAAGTPEEEHEKHAFVGMNPVPALNPEPEKKDSPLALTRCQEDFS